MATYPARLVDADNAFNEDSEIANTMGSSYEESTEQDSDFDAVDHGSARLETSSDPIPQEDQFQGDAAPSDLRQSLINHAATALRLLDTAKHDDNMLEQTSPEAPKYVYNTRQKKKNVHFAAELSPEITLNRAHHALLNPTITLPSSQWSYAAFIAEYDKPSIAVDEYTSHTLTTMESRRLSSDDLLKYDVVAYRFMQGGVFDGNASLDEVRESCFEMLVEGDKGEREGFLVFCRLRRMVEGEEQVGDNGDDDEGGGDMWSGFGKEAREVVEEVLRREGRS